MKNILNITEQNKKKKKKVNLCKEAQNIQNKMQIT